MKNADAYQYRQYFECACFHPTHTIKVEYDDVDNCVTVSVQPHIYEGFFKRVIGAFKHIFFKEELRWDSTILDWEDAARMSAVLNKCKDESYKDGTVGIDGTIY